MDKPDDMDSAFAHLIDQPIISDEEFPNAWVMKFRHHATSLCQMGQRTGGVSHLSYERRCVMVGILGDIIGNGFKIVPRSLGPYHPPNHLDILRSTSS